MLKFTVAIELQAFAIEGFAAVDRRRAMRLPDYSGITEDPSAVSLRREVSEGFARAWFGNELCGFAKVDQAWLEPGELIARRPDYPNLVSLNPEMSAERAQHLYVRARFEARKQG